MTSMLRSNARPSATEGVFGSGEGRLRFFRKFDRNGDSWSPTVVRSHYSYEDIKDTVERHFATVKPFLRHRYRLEALVTEVGIPRHVLSQFFKRVYGVGFPTVVNRSRIYYMMENLDRPEWRSYTQEGIGSECGFGSRNSFIKNVKKYLGKNPSDVLKEPMIRNVEWNRQLQVVRPAVSKELFSR